MCPSCQAANPPGTLFCVGCALPLGGAAPAAPLAAQGVRLVAIENLVPTGVALTLPDTSYDGALTIGRLDLAEGCVVDVDLTAHEGREKGVSRRHARLHYQGGALRLEDTGSAHGTYVNQRRLVAGEVETVADGDEIRLAGLAFRLEVR